VLGIKDCLNMNSFPIASNTGRCAASIEGGIVGSQGRLRSYEDLALLMQETLGTLFPLEGPFLGLADCRSVLTAVNHGFNALSHQGRSEARAELQALRDELSLSDPNGAWSKDIHADLKDTIRQCASPLNTLRHNLVQHITGYLAEADVRAAGAVNRKLRKATEDRLLAQAIKSHFSVTRSQDGVMPAFQAFLASIKKLDGYMQGTPLIALSEKLIRLFDIEDRTKVFDQMLSFVEAMPQGFRSKPLVALGGRFWELWQDDRHGRFDAILNLAKDMPFDEGWPVVGELAGSLNSLTDESVTNRFHALLDIANEAPLARRSACLVSLAKELACIPNEERMASFDRILQMNQVIPADEQGAVLVALATQCENLPEDARKNGFDAILDGAKALPDAQRAQPLVALAGRLLVLPDSSSMQQVLNLLLVVVESMTEGREGVLIEAANGLYGLDSEAKVLAREAVLKVAGQLPPEQRMLVQAQLEPLGI
jgi:hypothetical protein